ncbi:NADH-quinone oxidoreductase subunit M [Marinitoga hydrogenitolerans DSM 16785]|uniref:NADH-quinone oxidoreductase subunit M n=1 Tax=Marinitoga hydrogenitolerans (strain DSM 16785 / JCM 12826 / AT1271) TaxID=1122195 RepID=A0A1M4W794_MARH1|nr:proton-conducting transporter membrane subunit [Marinitoga hydrogenitolerans]SHE76842.1 NADH-quinone oxidoreductase subunit M [Marinitoga hydrogenitolerans DSM 16785]
MALNTLILFILLGSLVTYIVSKFNKQAGAWLTIIISLVSLFAIYTLKDSSGQIFNIFNYGNYSLDLVSTSYAWFFSIVMVIVYSMVAFFNTYWMEKVIHPAAYNLFYVLSLGGTIGVFYAKDFLTLFIFWELVVWSSMFIIPLGKSRRASVVYYGISTIGSFTMLYAILMLNVKYGTFEINTVIQKMTEDSNFAILFFFLIVIAGLTKLGVFPFHTWLPIAHGNAPHTFSPVLSGGLVKMGGFIAFLMTAVLPTSKVFSNHLKILNNPFENYMLMILGAISIIIGTLMAIKQDDAKKLIAYSTVSNSGYILIGLSLVDQTAFAGGMMHVFNHAMASAAMFLSFAAIAYRTGTTKISELGGLIKKMPVTFAAYLIAIISLAGIPPMSGFASKWLIFQGLIRKGNMFIAFAAFFGSVGSFLYVFRPLAGAFLGQLSPKHEDVKEVPFLMQLPMLIISGLTILYGIYPGLMLKYIAKIQEMVGIKAIVIDGFKIITPNGMWDSWVVTLVFTIGFVIAAILYFVLPKAKSVGLMDTYTSAEFIHDPDKYHYASNYYAPFERLYKNHPSVEKFYDSVALRVKELGQLVRTWFFNENPAFSIFWISLVITAIFMWGDKI